jgi:hypothetical protein
MEKTAVEWLKDLYENQDAYDEFILDEQWEKALEMEKEQIIDANIAGMEFIPVDPNRHQEDAEEYYNITFNTNEK